MPTLLSSQRRRAEGDPAISLGPPPSFLDTVGAAFRVAEDEQDLLTQAPRDADAYRSILDALRDMGVDTSKGGPLYMDSGAPGGSLSPYSRVFNRDAIIREVQRQKARNPKLFPEIKGDRATFERDVATRFGARADDQQAASRGNFVASLVGGVGSALTDPINLMTAPIGGGGGSLAKAVLSEALIGALGEVATLPDAARAKVRMGEEFSALDMAERVGTGALGSGVLGGAAHAVPGTLRAAKGAQEAALAKIIPLLPEKLRPSIRTIEDIPDEILADLAESTIGKANLTPDMKAAITVARRNGEVAAVNPFEPDAAGNAAHADGVQAAMARILAGQPSAPPVRDGRVGVTTPGQLRSGTAISTGTVAGDAESVVLSRIKAVEGTARNPNSSAVGPYQFLRGTWLRLYKSRYGANGLSDDAIAALRHDPATSEVLVRDLMAINRNALRNAGIPETPGNLYLAHFAGPAGARKLHAADPGLSARAVLGDAAVNANPFLERMTARDVIAWADRKMGGAGNVGPSGVVGAGDDVMGALERAMADNDAQIAALDAQIAAPGRGVIDDLQDDVLPDPVADGADIPVLKVPREVARREAPRVRREAAARAVDEELVSTLRGYATGEDRPSLNVRDVAKALDTDEATARAALDRLQAENKTLFERTVRGAVRRRRPPSERVPHLLDELRGALLRPKRGSEAHDGWHSVRHADVARHYARDLKGGNVPFWLFSKDGSTPDELGESLWERGYFGDPAIADRPTESDVLDLIDRAVRGEKIYRYDLIDASIDESAAAIDAQWIGQKADAIDFAATQRGIEALPDDTRQRAVDLAVDEGYDVDAALIQAINEEIDDQLALARELTDDARYDFPDDQPGQAGGAGSGGGGPASLAGDPGPNEADFLNGANSFGGGDLEGGHWPWEPEGPIEPDAYVAFDDIDSAGPEFQAQSVEHDLRAATTVRLYRGEAPAGSLENGDMVAAERGLWFTRDPKVARAFATDAGKVYSVEVPSNQLDAAATKIRTMTNGEEYMLTPDWAGKKTELAADAPVTNAARVPPLSDGSGSWIIVDRDTGQNVLEVFTEGVAAKVNADRYEVLTARQALARLNDPNAPPVPSTRGAEPPAAAPDMFGGPTSADVRASLERQGQGRMAGDVAQKPPGSDGGLFDTMDTQIGLRMNADGDPINPADLIADLDLDDAAVKTIRDCL